MEFSEEIDAVTKAFLSRKRNYYQNSLRNIFQRFILLDTLVYVLLLMLFVLLFHIPFKVAFMLLVLAWIVVLVYAKQKGVPYFYDSRIQTLSQEVDSTFLQVDQGIFTKVE